MTKITCKTRNEDFQAFYMTVDGKTYWLFDNAFSQSNKAVFEKGVYLDSLSNYYSSNDETNKTIQRIRQFVKFVEDENGLIATRKRQKRNTIFNAKYKSFNRACLKRQTQILVNQAI